MGIMTGVDGVRQKYIIRNIKPQLWVTACDAKTDEDILIYSVPLHFPGYDTNNRTVWHEIQSYCIRNTAYNWIGYCEANKGDRETCLRLF